MDALTTEPGDQRITDDLPALITGFSCQGEGVECIAQLEDGTPVAVRSGKLMATAFHPELTPDTRIHEMFLRLSAGEPSPV